MNSLVVFADGYNTDDVVYIWTHGPDKSINIANDMTLSQFDLIGYPHTNENVTHTHNNFGQWNQQTLFQKTNNLHENIME